MASVNIKVNLITKAAEIQLERLNAILRGTKTELGFTERAAKGFGNSLGASFRQASLAFGQFGTLMRAGLAGGSLFGAKLAVEKTVTSFAEFEKALLGVGKTSGLSGAALEQFGSNAQKLSNRIPIATNEILKLSQNAAQLGITGSRNLLKFAEAGARLASATNLSAEDAINGLSRIINITGGSQDSVDKLSNSLIRLGNQFNGTESEILETATRLAGTTAIFDLTGDQVLALSTALVQAGVNSEAGSTQIGKFFRTLSTSISTGNENLTEFAKIIGISADQLKKSLQDDAAGVFDKFIAGLARLKSENKDITATMIKLGLANDRASAALFPLIKISKDLTKATTESNDAFKNGTDAFDESDKVFKSVSGNLESINIAFTNIFTNIGRQNKGVIASVAEELKIFTQELVFATDPNRKFDSEQFSKLKTELQTAKTELNNYKNEIELGTAEVRNFGTITTTTSQELAIKTQKVSELSVALEKLRNEFKLTAEEENKPKPPPPDNSSPDDKANAEIESSQRIQDLRLQLFEQEELQRAAQDGQITEREQLKVDQLLFINRQAMAEANLDRQRGLLDAKKFAELELKTNVSLKKQETALIIAEGKIARAEREQRLADTSNMFGALAGLAKTGGAKYFKIFKALSIAQVTIDGYTAIQKAATAVPYPFNIPGIIAETARAATSLISVNQTSPGFQDGGIVPGNSFSGDSIKARVNSGEMILNRAQQSQLFNIANGRSGGSENARDIVVHTSVQLNEREIARAVSRQVADGAVLGELE